MKNKLSLFDYVYYISCRFYDSHGESATAGLSGVVVLSLFQTLNIILIYLIVLGFIPSLPFNKYWIVLPYVVLLIINGVHHNKYNYNSLKEKLNKESENENIKNKKIGYAGLYMWLSVIVLILFMLFLAIR